MSNNPGKMEGGDSDGPMEETLHGHKKSVHKKPNWLAHIINPDSLVVQIWMWVVCISSVYTCFASFLMATFDSTSDDLFLLTYLSDLIYLVYTIHNFFLMYKNNRGIPVANQRSIARHYLKSGFFLDLFSLLPSEIVVISVRKRSRNRAFSLFRLNRLLRFWTVMVSS